MKITITGSLGNIGKPLTSKLVDKGHEVTVITSKPEKKKEIEALGAAAAIGNAEDADFLTEAFSGADFVHAMVPPNNTVPNPMKRHEHIGHNLAEAISRSGVKRVLYVSSYGAHLPKGTGLIVGHHHVENALNAIPTIEALTHLRATYIYYNIFAYINMIRKAGVIAANYGDDDRVVLVSPLDIAAAAAEEIETQKPGRHVRYVASDERTCNEIAQILGKAIGMPALTWKTISSEEMQRGMESNGLSAPVAANLVEMFYACHTGLLHEDYDLHKPKKQGMVKTEDFAADFAAAFNQR